MNRTIQIVGAILLMIFPGSGLSSAAEADTIPAIPPGEIELASSLRQREKAVAARERELSARADLVKQLEKELEIKLGRLTELQKDVQEKLAQIKEAEDKNFRSLVRVYSSMKPSGVALILNQMEDDAAVRILRAMKTETTAQIMPKLDRDKAVRISKQLGMID